ncbi:hypothetical protein D3C79_678830 [compost metagenome]
MLGHEAVDRLGVARPHQLDAVVVPRLLVEGCRRRQGHLGCRRRSGRSRGRCGRRLGNRCRVLCLGLCRFHGRGCTGTPSNQLVHHRRRQGAADVGLCHQLFDHFVGDDDTSPLVIARLRGDRLALDLLGQSLGIGLPIPGNLLAPLLPRCRATALSRLGAARRADAEWICGDRVGQRHPLGRGRGLTLARLLEQREVTQRQQTGGRQGQHGRNLLDGQLGLTFLGPSVGHDILQ